MKNSLFISMLCFGLLLAGSRLQSQTPALVDQCGPSIPTFENVLGMNIVYGCYINNVVPGSLADQKGLRLGDFVISLNSKKFREFTSAIEFALTIKAEAVENQARIDILKHDEASDSYDNTPRTLAFDLIVSQLKERGPIGFRCAPEALIRAVADGTPAAAAGVQPGEFIHGINGEILANVDNPIKIDLLMQKAIRSGKIILDLGRWGRTFSKSDETQRSLMLRQVTITPASNP